MLSSSPCSNPGCKKEGISKCSACLQVFYCGQTCQKTHWSNHKKTCKTHRQQQQPATEPLLIDKAGPRSWMWRNDLVSVIISSKVTSIGKQAFYGCSGLTSIVIPDSVTRIGHHVFYHCTGLISLVIPDSVTSIDEDAFEDCNQLEQVIAPARFHHLFAGNVSLTEPTQYLLK